MGGGGGGVNRDSSDNKATIIFKNANITVLVGAAHKKPEFLSPFLYHSEMRRTHA